MHITFDYRCPNCGHQETRLVRRSEMDQQGCPACAPVSSYMVRLPAGTRTHFRFADTRLKR